MKSKHRKVSARPLGGGRAPASWRFLSLQGRAWISDRTTVITRSEPDIRIFTKFSFKLYLQLASAALASHHIGSEKVRTALDEPHAAWEPTCVYYLAGLISE